MILVCNTDICIAYKNKLGVYKIKNISLFNLNNIVEILPVESFRKQGREISFSIKCPICDEKHSYSYCIGDVLKRQMIIGGCEITSKPVFIFGNTIKVLGFIEKYNEVNRKIYAML
jgi:hypothetical protein